MNLSSQQHIILTVVIRFIYFYSCPNDAYRYSLCRNELPLGITACLDVHFTAQLLHPNNLPVHRNQIPKYQIDTSISSPPRPASLALLALVHTPNTRAETNTSTRRYRLPIVATWVTADPVRSAGLCARPLVAVDPEGREATCRATGKNEIVR